MEDLDAQRAATGGAMKEAGMRTVLGGVVVFDGTAAPVVPGDIASRAGGSSTCALASTGTRRRASGCALRPGLLDQDRLRGNELEDRVVESLLATLARRDLLEARRSELAEP